MKISEKNNKAIKFYALIGSTSSHLQTLINNKKVIPNQHNVYESIKENIFAKVIMPKLKEGSFKIQVHITEYYQLMYPFKNAVLFLTQEDLDSWKSNLFNKPINPMRLFQLCIILEYQNIYIVVEKKEQIDQFKLIRQQIQQERDLSMENQKQEITYYSFLTIEEFSLKNLKGQEFPKQLGEYYLETNFVVTNIIDKEYTEIIVVYGVLFKGQKIFISDKFYSIANIKLLNNQIDIALEGMIVQIKTTENFKPAIGKLGCYQQLQYFQLEIEFYTAPSQKEQILDISHNFFKLSAIKDKPHKNKQKIVSELRFTEKVQVLANSNWLQLISFSHIYSNILGKGKIMQKPSPQKNTVVLIPKIKFTDQFTEDSDSNGKFISKCRLCKASKIDTIILPCGHVRYCFDCAVQLRECYYCDLPIQTRKKCEIKACPPQIYKQLNSWFLDLKMVQHQNFSNIPEKIKFEIQTQSENLHLDFKCCFCKKETITHIVIQEGQNEQFCCALCAYSINTKTQQAYKIRID